MAPLVVGAVLTFMSIFADRIGVGPRWPSGSTKITARWSVLMTVG
jgi:hypothetical protein